MGLWPVRTKQVNWDAFESKRQVRGIVGLCFQIMLIQDLPHLLTP